MGAGAFVYRGGQLGLFSQIMEMNPYKGDKGPFGVFVTFCAATAGRTAVMPFNYPFDTVRRRLMLESEKPVESRLYKGGVDCFFKVMKAEGFAGMYKGMVAQLFRWHTTGSRLTWESERVHSMKSSLMHLSN